MTDISSVPEELSFNETDAYHVMPKPVGPVCNMACEYCYYTQINETSLSCKDNMMSEGLLELFIRQTLLSQKGDCISITWHGGEPLLRDIGFFKKAIELQRKYARGRQVENSLQTNGLLVDEDWCRFFHENRFLVGLSKMDLNMFTTGIDGTETACYGECSKNRFAVSSSGERGHNYLCEGLKLFFRHTEPSMRFMRNELMNGRPAANVMRTC